MKPQKKLSPRQLGALQEAMALHNGGRLEEADAIYRNVLREAPGHPDALHLRALVAHARGDFAEAARFAEAAIAQAPQVANFHNTAGEAWRRQGDGGRALKRLQEAIRLDPSMAMAHQNLALVLCERGLLDEALARCRRALALQPALAGARDALGEILARQARAACGQGDFPAARGLAREAVAAAPSFWGGWAVLAQAGNEAGDAAQAELHCTIAANLAPGNGDARLNLAHLLREQGRMAEARSHYEAWLAQHPHDASARFGRAVTCLAQGEYADGWPAYESRWHIGAASDPHAALPRWDGGASAHLLLYPEQGLGDFLQMLRFVPEAARRAGGRVTLQAPAPLARLVRRNLPPAIEVVAEPASAAGVQHACPLMSLPLRLGITSDAQIAAPGPYLQAQAQRTAQLRALLAAHPGRKLGIVWRGAAGNAINRRRALEESALLQLLELPGWTVVSLQFGVADPAIAGRRLVDLSQHIEDFEDLAAAMQAVDAVVSLDTGPAHLAGALGLPVAILVPWLHDWRWGLQGDTCAWYPSATLVRQPVGGSWEAAIASLAARLAGRPEAPPAPAAAQDRAGPVARNAFPLVQAHCRDGLFTLPLFDRYVSLSLLMYGEYSPREAAVLASWLRPGDTAVDVGANLGALTLAMARAVGPRGRVIAFEPQAAICACLRQTVADSGMAQVEVHRRAVGAAAGRTAMARLDLASPANFGGASLAQPGQGEEVELVRLDDLELASCRLVKIDVEGHELEVLRGAAGLIARCRPVIQVEADRPESRAPLVAFLRQQGYRVFRHEPPLFDAGNHRGCPHDAFPGIVSGNLVALPPGEAPPQDAQPA